MTTNLVVALRYATSPTHGLVAVLLIANHCSQAMWRYSRNTGNRCLRCGLQWPLAKGAHTCRATKLYGYLRRRRCSATAHRFSHSPTPQRAQGSWEERLLKDQFQDRMSVILFEQLCICLVRNHSKNIMTQQMTPHSNKIAEVLKHIHNNAATATLTDVATTFSYTPEYLCKLIKTHTGCTFNEIRHETLMHQVDILLRNSSYPVEKVAEIVGYSSLSNFYRVFNKFYGLSPAKYRSIKQCESRTVS